MNHCVLHVEVTLEVTAERWLALCESAVPVMARLPGLLWKLWVLDRDAGSAGGVYLFESVEAARAYAEGPVIAHLRSAGVARAVTVRVLPLVDALSQRTRGLPAPAAEPSPAPAAPTEVNGLAPAALAAAVAAIAADPRRAPARFHAKSTWQGRLRSRTEIESYSLGGEHIARRHTLLSDEPEQLFGENTAPNPQDLLLAALGACMLVGFVVGATKRGIELEALSIESSFELDLRGAFGLDPAISPGAERLHYTVEVKGSGTPEQFAEIHADVMAQSPNRWHLAHPVQLESSLRVRCAHGAAAQRSGTSIR